MSTKLFMVKEYLAWLPKTVHLHGIHSPFIFHFQKKCLQDRSFKTVYNSFKAYRTSLLSNHQEITITDFGAGSRIFTTNRRSVSQIARYAGASLKRMEILYRVASYFQTTAILELGTSLGLATAAFSAVSNTTVTTLEGCPQTARVAQKMLTEFGYKNSTLHEGLFSESLKKLLPSHYDLIYFDGNHSKKATLHLVSRLLTTIHNNTIWIFDDIYWSKEMKETWQEIQRLPSVTVTVDCFWLGFVFFQKEQSKAHHSILL